MVPDTTRADPAGTRRCARGPAALAERITAKVVRARTAKSATVRFSGVAYAKLSPMVSVLCAVADCCC